MFVSIFTDELGMDLADALPYLKEWGLEYVDLRGRIIDGKPLERLSIDQLRHTAELLSRYGMQTACFESSIGKVPVTASAEVVADQYRKLDVLLQAADILYCRLFRCFPFWQPPDHERGLLPSLPAFARVLELVRPLAEKAAEFGITIAFENCGLTTWEALAVADALNMPNLALAWDPHNHWDQEVPHYGSVQAYLAAAAPRTKVVHVKAVGALPGAELSLPWGEIAASLAQTGYQGPLSVETHTPKQWLECPGRLAVNRQLVAFTQAVVNKAQEGGKHEQAG